MIPEIDASENSSPPTIRAVIEQYIQSRLNEKLEKLKQDDFTEREKLFEKYQSETWLDDASLRVSQIRLATHTPKQHHPSSKASAMFYAGQNKTHDFVGSQGLQLEADVIGNAAVLDVFKLLRQKFNGISLLERLLKADQDFIAALSNNVEQAEIRYQRFLAFSRIPSELNAGRLSKQVYFPVNQDNYHILVILYPSALVHRVYQQISHDRFGEQNKVLREARFKGLHQTQESREYPNLLVQNYGGSKPQNISQLNSDRRGSMWLLPSLPPVWQGLIVELPKSGSVFTGYLSNRKDVKPILKSIIHMYRYEYGQNNVEFRHRRDELVDQLVDCVIDMSFELQQSANSGWTLQPSRQFSQAESFWLDRGYREELFDKEDLDTLTDEEKEWLEAYRDRDWHTEVGSNFGGWLNKILTTKGKLADLDDHEARVWSIALRDKLRLMKEEFA
ncbi:type I-F CRISPR-associated protein Csy1 [Acinetobacter sp. S40]|uniref:type I-F CRISPR-associated protein Csy1 n=1 Tax=unclassified Acinetobacter TaxID=196816 RepID=UPI00190BD826|nr:MULTISPECIES: type I-F CRISPR-associated protein Csy1 [unclassified Acinetobacter]MBJ9985831.1 type I-F CRISPR-associated protein Csy1 [Acinetobacter sp. S40]MBK0063612.1 type I-F CRISPR-associated protein Csy1 [Acinetobacter sp. S55]MBK0067490.1 type I-F CRISPR-associated protein Csy1 [Acinetobacter sp. S54]